MAVSHMLSLKHPIMLCKFIDGHHRLIRWRFVTHGGIDGYSRMVVFVKCSTNNQPSTLYELFLAAIAVWTAILYMLQSRENRLIA